MKKTQTIEVIGIGNFKGSIRILKTEYINIQNLKGGKV